MKNDLSACISYFSQVCNTAEVLIKMHALKLCFISAACFSAFIAIPTSNIFLYLFSYSITTEFFCMGAVFTSHQTPLWYPFMH